MKHLEVNSMIRREMENKRLSTAEVGRLLEMAHSSVTGMLQRSSIQVQRLADLSELLKYNFFREIAEKFPYPEPDYTEVAGKMEVTGLQNRVRDLELEISILRQTIRDLVSR